MCAKTKRLVLGGLQRVTFSNGIISGAVFFLKLFFVFGMHVGAEYLQKNEKAGDEEGTLALQV